MVQAADFDPAVPLPPGLDTHAIRRAIDYIDLDKDDWKYEGSTAGMAGGGRTHTFGVKAPAKKLRGTAVYKRKDIIVRGGKPIPANGQDQT